MDKKFTDFVERVGEESILSEEEQEALSKLENEHQVVAFVTPHLEKVFCNCGLDVDFSIFNSEEYKWIEFKSETSKYNGKPDLLVCHPAFISRKPSFRSEDPVLNQMRMENSFEYGVLSKWRLRDAIGLTCEAKVSIDDGALGEVINYGSHLCFGKNGCISTRLILFDKAHWSCKGSSFGGDQIQVARWGDNDATSGFYSPDPTHQGSDGGMQAFPTHCRNKFLPWCRGIWFCVPCHTFRWQICCTQGSRWSSRK